MAETIDTTALIERGEELGCLNLSELSELVQEAELDDDELEALYKQFEERGIELTDDCGRAGSRRAPTSTGTSSRRRPTRCSSS